MAIGTVLICGMVHHRPTFRIDETAAAHDDAGAPPQRPDGLSHGVRCVFIITAEPGQDLSAGHGKPLVDGVRLTPVRGGLNHQLRMPGTDLEGSVRGPAIHDNVLDAWIALLRDTP